MPELFRLLGFRFFFYSEEHLPIHVHVKNADGEARFEVKPARLISNYGMKSKDIKIAEAIIEENADLIEQRWKDYFKNM